MELKVTTLINRSTIFAYLAASIPVILGVFVFLIPFPHTTSIKEICYYLSMFLVVALFLFKKITFSFQTPLVFPGILFAAWSFVGLFFAVNPANSMHDFYAHLLKYIFLYFILVNFFDSIRKISVLSWIIICSASSLFVWRLYYFYVKLGTPLTARFGEGFTEVTTNLTGIIAVISIIFCFHNISQAKGWLGKIFFSSCLLFAFLVIFLAQTRSVLLALSVSLVVIFFTRKKVLIGIFLLVGLVMAISPVGGRFTKGMTDDPRIKHALLVLEVVKDYPVTGIGFGMQTFSGNLDLQSYNAKLPVKFQEGEILSDPHNMYTDIVVRTGIPGSIFFFWVIFSFFRMLWRLRREGTSDPITPWATTLFAAGLSFFVIGFFEPVFSHYPESVLCVIFAMGTILWRIDKDSKSSVAA
jgi:hypothetical protein